MAGVLRSSFFLGFTAVVLPSVAHAQFDVRDERTGITAELHGGYGALSDSSPADTAAGRARTNNGSFGLQLGVGYRVLPILSGGLHFHLQWFEASTVLGMDFSSGARMFGFHARLHPLGFLPRGNNILDRLDLHVGLGFDPYVAVWSSVRGGLVGLVAGSATATTAGVGMPISVGAGFYPIEHLGVQLLGVMMYGTASSLCASSGLRVAAGCSDVRPVDDGWFFYLGLGVTFRWGFFH